MFCRTILIKKFIPSTFFSNFDIPLESISYKHSQFLAVCSFQFILKFVLTRPFYQKRKKNLKTTEYIRKRFSCNFSCPGPGLSDPMGDLILPLQPGADAAMWPRLRGGW